MGPPQRQPAVRIRAASHLDGPLVDRLLQSGGVRRRPLRGSPGKGQFTLIAAVSGKISGVVSAQVKGRSAYLFDLFVMKPQRGRGVARALFAAVERHCQERGARRLALHCEKGSGNEAWYRRMGYMRRTEHTDFWGGRPGSKSTTLVYMVKRIEPLMRGVNRA